MIIHDDVVEIEMFWAPTSQVGLTDGRAGIHWETRPIVPSVDLQKEKALERVPDGACGCVRVPVKLLLSLHSHSLPIFHIGLCGSYSTTGQDPAVFFNTLWRDKYILV